MRVFKTAVLAMLVAVSAGAQTKELNAAQQSLAAADAAGARVFASDHITATGRRLPSSRTRPRRGDSRIGGWNW